MAPKKNDSEATRYLRREFLRTTGASVAPVALLAQKMPAQGEEKESDVGTMSSKFVPIHLTPYFNASAADFGSRERVKSLNAQGAQDGLLRTPAGTRYLRGIPFELAGEGVEKKRWVALSTRASAWTTPSLEIPLSQEATFVCLATFCDWDENEERPASVDLIERVGQLLAEVVLVYADGGMHALPIRRRFEVNSPSLVWGHLNFTSLYHPDDAPRELNAPLPTATQWGELQTTASDYPVDLDGRPPVLVWLCALANPEPKRELKALRFVAKDKDPLLVCALTLFQGDENPLRYERLSLFRITLPAGMTDDAGRWQVRVRPGVVARSCPGREFDPKAWLAAPGKGLGEEAKSGRNRSYLFVELAVNREATLSLVDEKASKTYEFDLAQLVPGHELEARSGSARLEILEQEKVWLHGQVLDATTGRTTPVRLAFRDPNGRYIPPYGHRAEINDAWFQDYGADVKVLDTSFAYVDGTFQVELPVGDVYLEMTKGYEYEAIRQKLKIEPGQRELKLEIPRFQDLRASGWVTADTHVHFLSPSTALLEGQAEGLNLINLLAAQWGDLFTNVGDLSYGPLTSRDGETIVQVSTENRQHILGHLGLLGVQGAPVFPMSAGGPGESYLGDPLWNGITEWAETCRERKGLVVAPHFPYPTAELAVDIVLRKIDAVEVVPHFQEVFNDIRFLDWYRFLNCGYRLPAVGGTDKMGAYMPVGAIRTYAYLGEQEFSFANWAAAVRQGKTFATGGPLLLFSADGHVPGEEILLGAGGGTVEVQAEAKAFVPMHRLEVVLNGRVVATREEQKGARELSLKEKVKLDGPGWLAARCSSQLGPLTSWQYGVHAHTSPVYVKVPGRELFSVPVAAYLLSLIDGCQMFVENLATRPTPDRLERVRKVFEEARAQLQARMRKQSAQD